MANLKYKTRGNSNPKGKPRVYFCCHPEDFKRYFESVSNEILAKQNCAIWYTDEVIIYDEDFFLDMRQMQLFVIPVTSKLLLGDSDTLDIEIRFAVENQIPILPLMQENGLDETFNKKFGNLQFLNKYNDDATALSYDEKLQKYLESTLIGEELAEKIRAAFDAYVFLSYRKKDRKYAQELMRLIHKNELCRDIAIWYDEFLTPGENFNDSIKKALQKSDLFLLAVTPNLINEPNYIMTTEFPMAKREGKPILPVELVPTDRDQLAEKYEDIPDLTDAHNEIDLSNALMGIFREIFLKGNDNSPEHVFFVGLAYLGGVDVEIDYERALQLITSAAESGLVEAINKIIHMYEYGEGVSFDSSVAMQWRKRLIGILKEKYDVIPSEENALTLLCALRDYYDAALVTGNIDDLNDAVYEYYSKVDDVIESDEELEFTDIDILMKTSYIDELRGDLNNAVRTYNLLLSSINKYIDEYKMQRGFQLRGICLQRLGKIFIKVSDYSNAIKNLKKATRCFEKLAKKSGGYKEKIIECYIDLAETENAEGCFDTALQWSNKAMSIVEELVSLNPDVGYEYDMCKVMLCMGISYWGEKKRSEAIRCYKNAISCAESLANRSPTERNIFQLGLVYKAYGKLFDEDGNCDGAIAWYKKCISKYINVINNDSTIYRKRELADTLKCIANVEKRIGDIKCAKMYFQEELEVRKQIAETGVRISTFWNTIIKVADGEIAPCEAAEEADSRAVIVTEDLETLSDCYMALGDCHVAEKELVIAIENYTDCLKIREDLFKEYASKYTALLLQKINKKLAEAYKEQNKIIPAIECFEEVAFLLRYIISEDAGSNYKKQLLYCYLEIGELLEMAGKFDKAINHYEEALAYCESNYSKEDTEEDKLYMLCITHYFCYSAAMIQFKCKKYKEAKGWISKAVLLLEQLHNKEDTHQREQLKKAYQLAIDIAWKNFSIRSIVKYTRKLRKAKSI